MRIKNYFQSLFISIVFVSSSMYGQAVHKAESNAMIRFTENKNQWDSRVLYKAQLDGGAMFLEKNCFTYNFYNKEAIRDTHLEGGSRGDKKYNFSTHAYRMTFLNALFTTKVAAKHPTSDYCNYFLGKNKNTWAGNVKNFQEVNYSNIYKNINLQLIRGNNSLKYNFFVSPGGEVKDIQMFYEGVSSIKLENGTLRIKTSINELTEHKPFAYQWINSKKVEVPCEFVLEGTTVSFRFAKGYDKERELVIDPHLVFAASSGSTANNFGHSATYDNQGNLISGGIAFGTGYPVKLGAYDGTANGEVDVVITKYNDSGSDLIYSTYLGGAHDEVVTSIIVDNQDNLLMYGVTGSSDFPVTTGAYDTTFNGGKLYSPHVTNGNFFQFGTDLFLCKLNNTGTSLLASTFIGGSSNDGINCNNVSSEYTGSYRDPITGKLEPYNSPPLDSMQYNYGDYYRGEINLDKLGNVYVASSTRSKDFPANGYDTLLNGQQDAVVFKMSNDLKSLIWSTYLGGNDNDAAYGLVIDDTSNVYVSGGTRSNNFKTSPGAVKATSLGGKADGFLAKLSNDGKALLASTYYGTDKYDQCFYVQLDRQNNVYVVGQTDGVMPISPGVFNKPNSGQFISKLNNTFTKVIFSTLFGNGNGVPNISPTAFLVDECENIYVSSWATAFNTKIPNATDMPVTADAEDKTTESPDFYLIVLTSQAKALWYGTYLGGNDSGEHVHGGTSRFDKKGILYQSLCTGCGGNQDFPVTDGAWPPDTVMKNGAYCNNGVFKLNFQIQSVNAKFTVDSAKGCTPYKVKFNNQSTSWTNYLWDFGNGDTTSTDFSPTRTYTVPGTYYIKLKTINTACNTSDVDSIKITVYPSIAADFELLNNCTETIKLIDSSKSNPFSWHWDFGDGKTSTVQNPVYTYAKPGAYTVELIVATKDGCKDTTQVSFDNSYEISVNKDTLICEGGSAQLQAAGGYRYSWLPVSSLDNPNIENPIASPIITTTYTVQIFYVNAMGDSCSKELTTKVNVFDKNSVSIKATADRDTVIKGESTMIRALINPAFPFQWTPATDVQNPKALNTIVTPQKTTTYTVSITAGDCSRSDTVTIFVLPNECEAEDIFVPNTFTPNEDGENDILYARSNVVSTIYFAVYNRWGELMFETTDLKNGWNGNYKGMKADPAVFAWYVKGKCYNGKEFFKKGNVTLIR
jgi:gliding motility-associated-like protein